MPSFAWKICRRIPQHHYVMLLEMTYGVRNSKLIGQPMRSSPYARLMRKITKCLHSGERLGANVMVPSSESLATRDYYSASPQPSLAGEVDHSRILATLKRLSLLCTRVVL
ncbi:unnamed protein product [Cuscuta epithymum]|uniref:Uncharacterized protein n=1 Tax=Cuscuta epithymum TaxID=186058 RepID=A0AAV0CWV2_9ASTE|nr:unnamed protein product [Cuscuta epithymum]